METGQITGTVQDPTGAVVPGAKVTATAVQTRIVRTTETSADGYYNLTNLLPGEYTVAVEAQGFSRMEKRATLAVGARIGIDFRLEVGRTETVVEVVEASSIVNTETQTIQTVISSQAVVDLPSLTRNPYDFVVTAGNVSEADPTGRGAGVAINGQRAASTNILLDGSANNDEFVAAVGQNVPLDSVQEFSVLTSNFTAEFGRASGGVVNVVTKSGTNDIHGSAYEFNRVSRLVSNSFDNNANGIDKPIFTRNQFGYSVGGPIKKNKLFFFQNTEWIRVRSAATRNVYIASPELIAASASNTQAYFSELGQLREGLTNLGSFSRNDLIAQGYDPCPSPGPCQSLSADMPLFQRVSYNYPSDSGGGAPQNTYMLVARADWNVSDKTQMYFRYARENENDLVGSVADSPYAGYDSGNTDVNNNFLVSLVRSFTPTTNMQSKVVFNRLNNQQPLGERPETPTLYLGSTSTRTRILGTDVAMPGYLPFTPGNGIPFGGPQNFLQVYQDFAHTRGAHQLRFGGSYVYLRDNRVFGAYQNPVQGLGTNVGRGLNNFILGQVFRFQAAIDPQGKYPCGATVTPECTVTLPVGQPDFGRSNRYHEFAFYGQDAWKVTPRFTINLGLRWEYFGVQHNEDPSLDSNYYDGTGANIWERIRNGSVMIAKDSPIGGLWGKDWNNWAPRVGFAWDISGDGRTSLRGGYGLAYERNFGNVTFNVIQNPPAYAVIALDAGVDIPSIPLSTDLAGPLAGSTGSKALPRVSLRNVDANIKTAYAHFWSASLERQVTQNFFASLDYTGSKGEKLYSLENVNMAGAGAVFLGDACEPGACTVRLRTTQYTNNNRRGQLGFSDYHAMNLRVQMRNIGNSGLNLVSNYTWSHAIDNLSSTFSESVNNYNLGLLDPFNPELDKGNADFDIRHRWAISGWWNVPFARNTKGAAKHILDGWIIAPIFTTRTGSPFSVFDTTNAQFWASARAMFTGPVSLTGSSNPPPLETPNTFKYMDFSGAPIDHDWVNPITGNSEFGPWPGTMTGRNAFRAPGRWNIDFAVYKENRFGETFRTQLRFEFYNGFNHSNLIYTGGDADLWATDVLAAQRGVYPSGATENRNVQLALKLIW